MMIRLFTLLLSFYISLMPVLADGVYFACTQPCTSHTYDVDKEVHGMMNGAIQQFELPRLLINRSFGDNLIACIELSKSIGAAYKSVDALGNVIDCKGDYYSHKLK